MSTHISNKKITDKDHKLYDYRDRSILEPLIFSDCEFFTEILFQFSEVKSRIFFERCIFHKKVIFGDKNESYHAVISQNIECNGCEFHDKFLLDGINCSGNIFLNDCKFSYKSSDTDDYGLSISRSIVGNSIQARNCTFSCGIDLSNSTISHNGCIFEDVSIKAKKGELKFTSCHVGKELSFIGCSIVIERILMDQIGVDDINSVGAIPCGCPFLCGCPFFVWLPFNRGGKITIGGHNHQGGHKAPPLRRARPNGTKNVVCMDVTHALFCFDRLFCCP